VKTLHRTLEPAAIASWNSTAALEEAAAILRAGGLVAFPTETVYGLGANALDSNAVARIFQAKKRPSWDPIIVHIPDLAMLDGLVTEIPAAAQKLIDAFWPGPLTLLLPRSKAVPDAVTAGRPLVGVRMPAHPVALELIRRAGLPIAAPSANLFGHISPTTAAHVLADLDGRIDAILDAGSTEHGVESTVLDPCQTPMVLYRPGAVTADQIRALAGAVAVFAPAAPLIETGPEAHLVSPRAALPSPGVGLRHYAPKARLLLVEGAVEDLPALLAASASDLFAERLGLLLPAEVAQPQGVFAKVVVWGRWSAADQMARELYAGLRALDEAGCTAILCPVPPAEGIGAAIRDRLRKAASSVTR